MTSPKDFEQLELNKQITKATYDGGIIHTQDCNPLNGDYTPFFDLAIDLLDKEKVPRSDRSPKRAWL